jgi:hypothetical protein
LLNRQSPLRQETSVTRRIDARGGMLAVDGAILIVPPGALTSPVEITLTVPEGDEVRAEFAPHGLLFKKPALLAFALIGSGVDASRAADELIGAYFQGEPSEGVVLTREVTPVERATMEQHTVVGEALLSSVEFPWDIRPMIRSHHERCDGQGYPDRLRGEEIPLAARVLCIADVYDALTTNRPYRRGFSASVALQIMREDVGAFDGTLLSLFEELVKDVRAAAA